jgi:dihydroorotase
MLSLALTFYHENKINLLDLFAKMTSNPARVLGIDRGIIEKGKIADLTLIDLNEEWVIKASEFESKSKNTPFDGRKVKGRAKLTMLGGEIVYKSI